MRRNERNRTRKQTQKQEAVPELDPYHSCQEPCSRMARQIALDIFPELQPKQKETTERRKEISQQQQQQQQQQRKQGESSPNTEQSLFGRILRQYLLDQRRKNKNGKIAASGSTELSTLTSKQKRKKRKKQKAGALKNDSKEQPKTVGDNETQPISPSLHNSESTRSDDNAEAADNRKESQKDFTTSPTRLLLLDKILDQLLQQEPFEPRIQNRELDSFLSFLQNTIATTTQVEMVEQENKNNVNKSSKQKKKKGDQSKNINKSKEIVAAPNIHDADIQREILEIGCIPCQKHAQRIMLEYSSSPISPMSQMIWAGQSNSRRIVIDETSMAIDQSHRATPGLAIPISGLRQAEEDDKEDDNDSDIHAAFNYHALEEGHICNNTESGLEFVSRGCSGIALELAEEGSLWVMQPLQQESGLMVDMPTLNLVVTNVLLCCGLSQEDLVTLFNSGIGNRDLDGALAAEKLQQMQARIRSNENEIANLMSEMSSLSEKIETQFEDASSSNYQQAFGAAVKKALTECDSNCDLYMEKSVALLLRLTDMNDALWDEQGDEKIALQLINDLWAALHDAESAILNATMVHQRRLLQLTGGEGPIPPMALNASHRISYRNMLDEKVEVISNLNVKLNKLMNERDENMEGLSSAIALFALEALIAVHQKSGIIPRNRSLDEKKKEMLAKRSKLIQIFHCPSAEALREVYVSLLGELENLMGELHPAIVRSVDCVDDVKTRCMVGLRAEWTNLSNKHEEAAAKLNASNAGFVSMDYSDDALSNKASHVIGLTSILNSMWLVSRRMQHCQILGDKPSMMQLRHSLPLPLRVDALQKKNSSEITKDNTGCKGGGGERRISSICAGLLYQWLTARCIEWNSDLAQKELLDSADALLALEDDGSSAKQATRKKSKKKNRKKATVHPSLVHPADTAAAQTDKTKAGEISDGERSDEVTEQILDDSKSMVQTHEAPGKDEVNHSKLATEPQVPLAGVPDNPHPAHEKADEEPCISPGEQTEAGTCESARFFLQINEYISKVGVAQHGNKVISAQEFLVKRLELLMSKQYDSFGKKQVPIVNLAEM